MCINEVYLRSMKDFLKNSNHEKVLLLDSLRFDRKKINKLSFRAKTVSFFFLENLQYIEKNS